MTDKVTVLCPECGVSYKLTPDKAGKRVKCRKCNNIFEVVIPQPEPNELVEELEDALDDFAEMVEPTGEPSPARSPRSKRGRKEEPAPARAGRSRGGRKEKATSGGGNKGLLFGLIGVGAVVIAVVLFLVLTSGPPKAYLQASESAYALSEGRAKVEALVDLSLQTAAKKFGEWGEMTAGATNAMRAAENSAKDLPNNKDSVATLLGLVKKLTEASHFSGRSPVFLRALVANAKGVSDPGQRLALLVDLAGKLAVMTKPAGAAKESPALLQEAFRAAMAVSAENRVEALLNLADKVTNDKELVKLCHEKVLEVDGENDTAHQGLGHQQVAQDSPVVEMRGKWLASLTSKRQYRKKLAKLEAEEKKLKKDKHRWSKDRFAKRCKKLRDEMLKEIPTAKWHFFFDDKLVKKPYLLAVEEPMQLEEGEEISSAALGTARAQGMALSGLVTNFYKKYKSLLNLKDPKRPRGVYVFKSKQSYADFYEWSVKKGNSSYPNPRGIGGFFSGNRERMYLWATDSNHRDKPMDLTAIMFHEGTHQLMHYNKMSPGPQIGNTPWLQEGLAEFFGGYYSRYIPGSDPLVREYRHGKFMEGRYVALKSGADKFRTTGKVEGILPLKAMMSLDYPRFRAAMWGRNRNPWLVSLVYAEGWAFIHFCNHYEKNGRKGYYRPKFEEYLQAEIEGIASVEKFTSIFGLDSDKDWEKLQKEFFDYLMDSDKGMRFYMYESRGRSHNYWPEKDGD